MAVTIGDVVALSGGTVHNGADSADTALVGMDLNAAATPEGGLFAAVPGTRTHGATYANQSAAAAVLTDEAGLALLNEAGEKRPVIVVDDVRAVMGSVAAEIYGRPVDKLTIIGVTGTSGKTTTTYMLESALLEAGCATGIIGTTGTRINQRTVPSSLTTPEAPSLQRLFSEMVDEGVTHVVMEVSSHALSLGRVAGVTFDVGCFLNLSQDHLDFHHTLEEYFEAKALLFHGDSPVHARHAVVCVDDAWGRQMAEIAGEDSAVTVDKVATHRMQLDDARTNDALPAGSELAWKAQDVTVAPNGMQQVTLVGAEQVTLDVPLPGEFNVANATVAWGALAAVGMANDAAQRGLAKVAVPGRMQRIDKGQDFLAVVDYAHKPAAVGEVLRTLRAQTSGKVIAVVGAGGDRDATKRPLMGAEAVKVADAVFVTDDNPRSEEPALIREAVASGAYDQQKIEKDAGRDVPVEVIGDRAEAISAAINLATTGDAVVVAGKGHETGQEINGVMHPFDDREEVAKSLERKKRVD
ncbi:UDP-N-acetylmuramoyl-L-alanyl-D-glutamate--2,6-diaminopimelate ligase [Corynebacterium sp. H113]|uniref:UDP-N-acetylmuramoyl-L-alanyl-D-glutamate--2, 6-diaminopimelate ligase n=1 Tax=Corynebacterium sp. H113 TaxID=3133419 RepID=UPI0030AFCDFB